MKKYLLLLGVGYLGVAVAAEPVMSAKPVQKKESTKKIEEPLVLDMLTIEAQSSNIDQPFGTYLDRSNIALSRTAASDTAKMLKGTPGMSFSGGGGISSRPIIHGMADDRLRVQVDGMNLISACANHMNPALSYVSPSSVLSAQVLAGITPVSMGGDSIGGTIRVNSADPEFAADGKAPLLKGQTSTFYRTNGDALGGNISASIANEFAELKYTGSTVQARNYKAGGDFTTTNKKSGNDTVSSSSYKSENQSLSLALRKDDHLAVIKVGQQHIPYQAFPNVRMDMTGDDSWFANVYTKSKFQWGDLETRAYHEDARHKMNFLADKGGPTRNMPMATYGVNQGLSLKANIDMTDKHLLTVGSEYQRYRLDDWWDPIGSGMGMMQGPGPFWNINGGKRDRIDLFTEWEGRWNQQWLTQLGARVGIVEMNAGNVMDYGVITPEARIVNSQNKKQTDVNIDWTALARYTPSDRQTYELGAARKTRSPNLYERFAWSRGLDMGMMGTMPMSMFMNNWVGDGNGYVGDINLKPEVAHTVSATANWHDADQQDWEAKVTPFYTHVENYIDARLCQPGNGVTCVSPSSGGFNLLQLANFDAHLFGVDVSGSKRLLENVKYGNLTGKTVLNYVRGQNNDTGDNLYQQMPFNATVALEHQRGAWSNTIETLLVAPKTDVQAVRLEPKTAGYALLNLRSNYTWKYLRIDGGIDNLLDKNYALPLGGTYIGEASPHAGTAVPGMGRSFNVGMTLNY